MNNEEWQETVAALVDAKRCLSAAWRILDGRMASHQVWSTPCVLR